MITNPNTLGVFETEIAEIAELLHSHGALVYMDGANLNAMMGITRPGDFGVDVLHINLHKTFTTPHGGGGPGSGPVAVKKILQPFLPYPVVGRKADGTFFFDYERPDSIGKIKAFNGQFGMHVRALCYILANGPEGLKQVSEVAVLNANYIRSKLKVRSHCLTIHPRFTRWCSRTGFRQNMTFTCGISENASWITASIRQPFRSRWSSTAQS